MSKEPNYIDLKTNINASVSSHNLSASTLSGNYTITGIDLKPLPVVIQGDDNQTILKLHSDGKLDLLPQDVPEAAQKFAESIQFQCAHIGSQYPFKEAYTLKLEEENQSLKDTVNLYKTAMKDLVTEIIAIQLYYKDITDKGGTVVLGKTVSQDIAEIVSETCKVISDKVIKSQTELELGVYRPKE